jgi:type IV pilus assembly protein PilY1
MNAKKLHQRLAPLLLLFACAGANAEDIDLFAGTSDISSIPNILFVFDNSANWNATIGSYKKYEMLHEAFYQVMTFPGLAGKMNVGMMGFADGNSPKGGKIISAVQPLTAEHQAELACRLYNNDDCVISLGNEALPQANNAPYALTLDEAYLYYSGGAPMAGLQDGVYNASSNPGGYDPAALSGGNYASPIAGNECGRNFIVLIGNGSPDNAENSAAEARLISRGGKLMSDPINLSPDDQYQSNWADEYARFLASTDIYSEQEGTQSLTTYVIDIFDPDSNQKNTKTFKGARAFLRSIKDQGKGRYFDVSTTEQIVAALLDILNEIQSVNSVFASTTLPVSVNVRGTNLNQVYMGVFRPDATSLPRWFGNLKLYRLAIDDATDSTYLADMNGNEATSSTTGFINHSALSYWTSSSSFWEDSPRGTPPSGSDSPDGAEVEKGGAAQHIRDNAIANGIAARQLYTCTNGGGRCTSNSLLSATPFNDSNSAIPLSDDLINWARGANNKALDAIDGFSSSTVRPSVHGDVLHSRPVVVNYNRYNNDDDVVAYYGSNDGFLHAVKGGMGASGGIEPGTELWGFTPREFFTKLERAYDLSPKILNDNNGDLTPTPLPKDYFADGSIGVYQHDANNDGILNAGDGDKVYIYLSMRRGGRLLYALDVSDPAAPRFLWAIDNNTTGFSELGYTWSAPKVAKINADLDDDGTNEVTPVVIFGGGYDPAKDDERASIPNNSAQRLNERSMGRAIYIVRADTGALLAWGSTDFSVPSDVTVIKDHQGYASKLYVGDTGANLWKIDISNANSSNWTMSRLASLSGTTSANFRKFLYPPDVVGTNDGYDAILIGSGDREDPFDTTTINRFYMIKDNNANSNVTESDLYDATDNLIQEGTDAEKSAAASSLASAKGWYITLRTGEKVISSAITLSGTTFFNTNMPAAAVPGSCAPNLGNAYIYMLAFKDARAVADRDGESGLTAGDRAGNEVPGGGLLPSPVPIVYQDDDGNKRETVCSGTQCLEPPGTPFDVRRRTYFYRAFE